MGGVGKYFGPMEFRADRPFLFYLIDRDNENIPLFVGRVHNPLDSQIRADNKNSQIHPDPLPYNNNDKKFNGPPKGGVIRHRPTHNNRPQNFLKNPNQVIYPQEHELSPPYSFHPHRRVSAVDFIFSSSNPFKADRFSYQPPRHELYNDQIMFPEDDHNDRFKRAMDQSSSSEHAKEEEVVDSRLKDPFWFSKPTVSEVIIPISNNAPPPLTNQFIPAAAMMQPNVGESVALSFNRPEPTTTMKPILSSSSSTIAKPNNQKIPLSNSFSSPPLPPQPGIFDALTVPPHRNTPSIATSGWNGVGASTSASAFSSPPSSTPPFFLASTWNGQSTDTFRPFSTSSGSPIFFPDFRIMDKKEQQ